MFQGITVIGLHDFFSESSLQILQRITMNPDRIFISSVVASVNNKIKSYLSGIWKAEAIFIKSSPLPFTNQYGAGDATGVDRLCNIAGALNTVSSPFVIADIGTAVNLEVVDNRGNFIGGNIFPGIRLQSQSLFKNTDALPAIHFENQPNPIGRNTEEAIQSGICLGIAGSIEKLFHYFRTQKICSTANLILTGGDATIISPFLDVPHTISPYLTLTGIYHLGIYQWKQLNS